ncbi:calcium homeostasis modulator protein 6-like [Clavelina lepadiformis]|uniref:calcium homeostasis modulator protein 6-like n=1 Tax=Clavelina lepadiformis TaxID=159417 RepID=UPI0040423D2A
MALQLQAALSHISEGVKKNRSSLKNTVLIVGTVGLNELITAATFQCPCVTDEEFAYYNLGVGLPPVPYYPPTWIIQGNSRSYGWFYLFAPAAILLMVSLSISNKFRKVLTGCCKSTNYGDSVYIFSKLWACLEVLGAALIAPCAWISFGLLKGEYYACAVTAKPYVVTPNETCAHIKDLRKTDEYNDNMGVSQVIGWLLVSTVSFTIWIIYTVSRCCASKNYYEMKYNGAYKKLEERALDNALDDLWKDETEEVAKNFLKSKPNKDMWNKALRVLLSGRSVTISNLASVYEEWDEMRLSNPKKTSPV